MDVVEAHIAIDPPRRVPIWDIDPYDPSVLSAPEGYYTELRAKGSCLHPQVCGPRLRTL